MKVQHLQKVIIALMLNFISSGYCDIQKTGGKLSSLYFRLPENGTMTIGYRITTCVTCFFWFYYPPCSDHYMYLRVNFANGRYQYIQSHVKCGTDSWSTIKTHQKSITVDGKFEEVEGDGSEYPLNGASLRISGVYIMEVKVIEISKPDRSPIPTSTPAPRQNTQVILGVSVGCVGILILAVIITIAVLWYMRKRPSQEDNKDEEDQDYADVTNTDDAIYMDTKGQCIYEKFDL
ncbi:uncharacterized protein [Palaemon carinicauda]|uniref:uncharacterized protein n=1 Tax=Palaemon carinicauda TaxID=392227 RepID=UPI0035B57600